MLPFKKHTALYDDPKAHHYKLIISYDGTTFWGWQAHSSLPTIELALHNALFHLLQKPFHLMATSRTDAGVHAKGQCVKLSAIEELTSNPVRRLNALLPASIAVISCEQTTAQFHPSLDAIEKSYIYTVSTSSSAHIPLHRHYQWHPGFPKFCPILARNKIKEATTLLLSTSDFTSLTNRLPDGKISNPQRKVFKITSTFSTSEQTLTFLVQGDSFSYKMVRNIVGSLVALIYGRLSIEQFKEGLTHGRRDLMGPTAPAHGLILLEIQFGSPSLKERT